MPECPISLEEVRSVSPPTRAWRIAPAPFNEDGKCTVKVTANGMPVTGTGHYRGLHITGWAAWNGTVVFDEPGPKSGKIVWEVTGERRVDPTELAALARLYQQPLGFFLG